MNGTFFDMADGDMCYSISNDMAMDSDGNMMLRMGNDMAMDMHSGELHVVSSWNDEEDDEWD